MTKQETKLTKNKMFSDRQFLVSLLFSDAVNGVPQEIHILPKGEWDHPVYGKMTITDGDIELFMKHFNDNIRNDIPITEGHAQEGQELPAVGWFKKLIHRENGLWALIDWTKQGSDLLAQKAYKYFSPEFYQTYEDPESREVFDNVLVGGALTNKPYFKELTPVLLSENTINYFKENAMDIKALMKKKASDLTKDEKAYIKSQDKSKMSEDEQSHFKAVFDEEAASTEASEEEKKEEAAPEEKKEEAQEEHKEEDKKDETDEGAKIEASEKNVVSIKASELKLLQEQADQGAKAFAELKKNKITSAAQELVFSEKNSKGKFLPKGKAALVKFMEMLTDKQLVSFQELMNDVPSVKLFGEIGASDATDATGSAKERVFAEIETMKKADSKLKFSDAVKQLGRLNPGLMKEYETEIAAK